ncbi:RNA polymerase sigma-70 factor, ECF subfamily [Methylophilus rhizosphaerae]|uniref:RNA polymerase sigma-70 factor, ECF subfamily n=2 Tax=Methylophilus rhizosphaerae TaxID=492660 RepID=A0A1G9BN90_9PROT|nr:RNA polymerase sigma-70 factor, ECF subfamily [Methylophilus rhizosphaerae]
MSIQEPMSQQSIAVLYSNHYGWLLGWLSRKLNCPHLATDLTQDTFLRIVGRKSLPDYREPKAYLTTIARGLLIDHWRKQEVERAWLETLAFMPQSLVPSAEEHMLVLEALYQVDMLLNQLKPKVREAFLLSQLDGLTYAQIAEKLGVGERMVKKYMAQAMLVCLSADSEYLP